MKYTIEHDDLHDHEMALNGHRMAQYINNMLDTLRSQYKYANLTEIDAYEFRKQMIELLDEYEIPGHLIE